MCTLTGTSASQAHQPLRQKSEQLADELPRSSARTDHAIDAAVVSTALSMADLPHPESSHC